MRRILWLQINAYVESIINNDCIDDFVINWLKVKIINVHHVKIQLQYCYSFFQVVMNWFQETFMVLGVGTATQAHWVHTCPACALSPALSCQAASSPADVLVRPPRYQPDSALQTRLMSTISLGISPCMETCPDTVGAQVNLVTVTSAIWLLSSLKLTWEANRTLSCNLKLLRYAAHRANPASECSGICQLDTTWMESGRVHLVGHLCRMKFPTRRGGGLVIPWEHWIPTSVHLNVCRGSTASMWWNLYPCPKAWSLYLQKQTQIALSIHRGVA